MELIWNKKGPMSSPEWRFPQTGMIENLQWQRMGLWSLEEHHNLGNFQVRILLVSVAVLGLTAACSDKGADHDGDGKITAEEVAEEMNKVTLEPGQWENSVEIVDVKIEGLPEGAPAGVMDSMKGKVTTSKSCITKEQAEDPGAEFFAAQEETNCEVKKFSMSGGAVSSEMVCSNMGGAPGNMTMAMDGQYGPSSYDMTMNMKGGASGMNMDITAKSIGKRIGACPTG